MGVLEILLWGGGAIVTVGTAIFVGLLKDEIAAYMPVAAKRLLDRAVAKLPEDLRAHYHEEWSADLRERPGRIAQVIAAFGFHQAARRLIPIVIPGRDVTVGSMAESQLRDLIADAMATAVAPNGFCYLKIGPSQIMLSRRTIRLLTSVSLIIGPSALMLARQLRKLANARPHGVSGE